MTGSVNLVKIGDIPRLKICPKCGTIIHLSKCSNPDNPFLFVTCLKSRCRYAEIVTSDQPEYNNLLSQYEHSLMYVKRGKTQNG